MLSSAIVNVILNLTLIPHFGTTGAAVATATTVSGSHFFLWAFAAKKIGLDSCVIRFTSSGRKA